MASFRNGHFLPSISSFRETILKPVHALPAGSGRELPAKFVHASGNWAQIFSGTCQSANGPISVAREIRGAIGEGQHLTGPAVRRFAGERQKCPKPSHPCSG